MPQLKKYNLYLEMNLKDPVLSHSSTKGIQFPIKNHLARKTKTCIHENILKSKKIRLF